MAMGNIIMYKYKSDEDTKTMKTLLGSFNDIKEYVILDLHDSIAK